MAAHNVASAPAPELTYATPENGNVTKPVSAIPHRNQIAAAIPVAVIAAFALAVINKLTIYFPARHRSQQLSTPATFKSP